MLSWLSAGRETEKLQRLQRTVEALVLRVSELSTKLSTSSTAALNVRLNELEAALDQLQRSNRREFGKLWKREPEITNTQANEIAPQVSLHPPCENWLAAQTEGPHSKAAGCDCVYCNTQRAARARARATLVPKTPAERRNAIERGKA